jgi:hypothetical protein
MVLKGICAEHSLNKNFRSPSKVWARPETAVPTALKAVLMTPRMMLKKFWKRPRMPLKTEVTAARREEMRDPIESTTEGMV